MPGVHGRRDKPPLARRWERIVLHFAPTEELDGRGRGRKRTGTGAECAACAVFGSVWPGAGEFVRRNPRWAALYGVRYQFLIARSATNFGDELGCGAEEEMRVAVGQRRGEAVYD